MAPWPLARCVLILALLFLALACRAAAPPHSAKTRQGSVANSVACTPTGRDPRTVGVIVLYAAHTFPIRAPKTLAPAPGTSVLLLVRTLRAAGFTLVMPDMPWTVSHPYDRSLGQTLDRIASIVTSLQARGAARVFVVGHSFGGGVALAFGARRGGVAGIVALAAGPDPSSPQQRVLRGPSVAKARAMVEAGHPDAMAEFEDLNGPNGDLVRTTAANYLSFYSPHSALSMRRNLARWPASLPLLWIDGFDEARLPRRTKMIHRRLPANPLSRYLTVDAAHTAVADASSGKVLTWIRCF